jgi:hypothetical protein
MNATKHDRQQCLGDGVPSGLPTTVRVGALERVALLHALRAHGVLLNQAAELLFQHHRFQPDARERVFEIKAWSGADLGFSGGATYRDLTLRAHERGFQECPLELGPHLRMQYAEPLDARPPEATLGQRAPPGSVTVASAALEDGEQTPRGFYLVRRDGRQWLRGYRASKEHVWRAEDVLVFCRPTTR